MQTRTIWANGGSKGAKSKRSGFNCQHGPVPVFQNRKGKTDPFSSPLEKIAKAFGLTFSEPFASDDIFKDESSHEKSLMQKLRLIDMLDDEEKKSIFNIVDELIAKRSSGITFRTYLPNKPFFIRTEGMKNPNC